MYVYIYTHTHIACSSQISVFHHIVSLTPILFLKVKEVIPKISLFLEQCFVFFNPCSYEGPLFIQHQTQKYEYFAMLDNILFTIAGTIVWELGIA